MKVLERLNKILEEKKIPSELTDDGNNLSLMLSKSITGKEIFGDIFYKPFSENKADGGYWIFDFEVYDASGLKNESIQDLSIASTITNPVLPSGGYGVRIDDDGESRFLIYRMSLPVRGGESIEWLTEEMNECLNVSNAILKTTAPDLIKVAEGALSPEEYTEKICSLS